MTEPHHDSAAFLEVVYCDTSAAHAGGWYVKMTCPCHRGRYASIAFATREQAERCVAVLDEASRRYG